MCTLEGRWGSQEEPGTGGPGTGTREAEGRGRRHESPTGASHEPAKGPGDPPGDGGPGGTRGERGGHAPRRHERARAEAPRFYMTSTSPNDKSTTSDGCIDRDITKHRLTGAKLRGELAPPPDAP